MQDLVLSASLEGVEVIRYAVAKRMPRSVVDDENACDPTTISKVLPAKSAMKSRQLVYGFAP